MLHNEEAVTDGAHDFPGCREVKDIVGEAR